jgi:plastocyanin
MNLFRLSVIPVVSALVLVVACSNYSSQSRSTVTSPDPVAATGASGNATSGTTAATPLSATMQFGLVDVGSGNPPTHPSFHSNDTIVPGTVVIDAGGTVTFNAVGVHQVQIYKDGIKPEQVNVGSTSPHPCGIPTTVINPDANTIPINGANPSGCGPRTYTHKFDTPGEYLVICSVTPHFLIKMYGWVRVRGK